MRIEPGGDGADGPLESSQPTIAIPIAKAASKARCHLVASGFSRTIWPASAGPLNAALVRIALADALEGVLRLQNAAGGYPDTHHHQECHDVLRVPSPYTTILRPGSRTARPELLTAAAELEHFDYHHEMTLESPQHRLRAWAGAWNVTIDARSKQRASVIGVGRRGHQQWSSRSSRRPATNGTRAPLCAHLTAEAWSTSTNSKMGRSSSKRLSPGDSLADLALLETTKPQPPSLPT